MEIIHVKPGMALPIRTVFKHESRCLAYHSDRATGTKAERSSATRHAQEVTSERLFDPSSTFAFRIVSPEIEACFQIGRSDKKSLAHFRSSHHSVQTRAQARPIGGERLFQAHRIVQRCRSLQS